MKSVTEPVPNLVTYSDRHRLGRLRAMLMRSSLYRELSSEDQERLCLDNGLVPEFMTFLVERLAVTLCTAVERRLRSSLGREFQQQTAELHRVRGHVDVLRTARKQLLTRARVACRFEILTTDTILNRSVRSALRLLQEYCRGRTRLLCRKFATAMERSGVQGPCPTEAEIRETSLRQARMKTPDAMKDAAMLEAARLTLALAHVRNLKPTSKTQENPHASACACRQQHLH